MPVKPINQDNAVPIVVGWLYRLPSTRAGNWIVVTAIIGNTVYVSGIDHTIASWSIPRWKFDDVVVEWQER